MPQLGETVQEGTVLTWFKKAGDLIQADEPLFEVETEKVTTEIPAIESGVLVAVLVEAGATVPVGTKLAEIRTSDEATSTGADTAARETTVAVAPPITTAAPAPAGETRIPLSRIRRQTAEHMLRSVATSPHVLQAVEVDYDGVDRARAARGAAWKAREGFTLTYLPFIGRAVCEAIAEYPLVNASIAGDEIIVHQRVHLGIAVDLGFEGLVVPVARNAQQLDVASLARELNRLAAAARSGALKPDEATGGTYTLSNSGSFGTYMTAAIINQPQVAILSVDGVRRKPVVVDGANGEAVAIRPVGVLAQSFDHRAFDGAYSAAFLRRVREIIETRDWTAALP